MPKMRAMMSLRIIEPEDGFDSRTLECQKCYATETSVVISRNKFLRAE